MSDADGADQAEAALRALENARVERERLGELGRWSEADEVALSTLRDVLSVASPDIIGPDLGGLVYVAGSPRKGSHARARHGVPVPAERLTATCAMLLANRGRDPESVVEMATKALASFNWRDVGTLWYSVLSLAYADEGEAARRFLDHAMARSGWAASTAIPALRARVAGLGGAPATAVQILEDLVAPGSQDQFTEVAVAWSVEALVDLGDLDRADDLLRKHGFNHSLDRVTDTAEVLAARGALHHAAGRTQLAYEDFTACGRELARWGVVNPAIIPWRSQAALCAAAMGREALALSLTQEELAHARRWGTPRAIGTALRAASLVSMGDQRLAGMREAVGLLARSGAKGTLIRAQYELGVRSILEGQHEDGCAALRDARETAGSVGNQVWTGRVDDALGHWAGIAEQDRRLTPQERKIANLARAGLSNKEIAGRAGVSSSTVEFHLSNVYRKLEVSGRSGLRSIMVAVL
ncbi:hypothetical protein GCM10027598_58160 [Amycolatopsis oliviviridis]|uniref:HTH luxR-type domain-containing protein n=1 Tax=Amycolatopsis oliviviridis TaxID=1471590 RepID=A0ABQ3LWZ5_9PSEU|nr:LuxR C-terminal-related transcriptional regulator [Amycolatopsis oliviviridis]GHH28263.1 hypothetical protein GCM10017790_58810 [Amycolatopsis oliviviridis]